MAFWFGRPQAPVKDGRRPWLWVLFIYFWFHTELSTCWLVGDTLFFKRNTAFLDPFFPMTMGHWPWPQAMYILSNGSESNLQITPLRYSSRVSRNPNLFEYVSFWAHDKTAQIPLQSMQMMHFVWLRVYKVYLSTVFPKRNATFHAAFLLKKSVENWWSCQVRWSNSIRNLCYESVEW